MPIDGSKTHDLSEWFREKGVRLDCPACGASSGWETGDVIAPPTSPDGGGTVLGGPSFPLVQVICPNCAYVMHFASPRIGLLEGAAFEGAATQ